MVYGFFNLLHKLLVNRIFNFLCPFRVSVLAFAEKGMRIQVPYGVPVSRTRIRLFEELGNRGKD